MKAGESIRKGMKGIDRKARERKGKKGMVVRVSGYVCK